MAYFRECTLSTSIGLVNAVAMAPEKVPEAIFTNMFVESNITSHECLQGSYNPNRRPPYRTDLVNAGASPRYRDLKPSSLTIRPKRLP